MKITFVLPAISISGGARAVFEIANRLKERGHAVSIVYPLFLLMIVPKFNIKILITRFLVFLKNLTRSSGADWFDVGVNLIRIPTLSSGFFENKIPDGDVIIATSWETAYPVSQLSPKKGKKFYFVQHYEVWDIWNNINYWERADKLVEDQNKKFLFMADIIPDDASSRRVKEMVDDTFKMPLRKITTSFWLKELIEKKFCEKADRVILGVNFNEFNLNSLEKKPNKEKTILMSYRKTTWKGDGDGLGALRIVRKKFPNLKIVMYGKKDKNIPKYVEFHERVFGTELKKLYSLADIFVFPSWVEGWGMPPMEAMACGTACVVTNSGGVLDYIIPDKTALVVPARNPEKLAMAIIELLTDNEKRSEITRMGYEHIKQFTWERTVEEFENILKTS